MLGLVLTHFRIAWTNSFLNRQAQQEKSQRPLCSTCTDDSTIASGETKKSSRAQIWYILEKNTILLPKAILMGTCLKNWTVEIFNPNARYSASCVLISVEDILDNFNNHRPSAKRDKSEDETTMPITLDQPTSQGNIRSPFCQPRNWWHPSSQPYEKICLRGKIT